jgi:hypothetical protein
VVGSEKGLHDPCLIATQIQGLPPLKFRRKC